MKTILRSLRLHGLEEWLWFIVINIQFLKTQTAYFLYKEHEIFDVSYFLKNYT